MWSLLNHGFGYWILVAVIMSKLFTWVGILFERTKARKPIKNLSRELSVMPSYIGNNAVLRHMLLDIDIVFQVLVLSSTFRLW
jgi:hypothetical protein